MTDSDPIFEDSLPALDFPEYHFVIRKHQGKKEIFDFIRRKYVALTPEEWVRQHTLHYLNEQLHIPAGLIIVEKSLSLNTLAKRADILVYDKKARPCMLVECKAAGVKVTQYVFEQIAHYNIEFKVKYLFVTNGIEHFVFMVDHQTRKITALKHFPDWGELNLTKED
jgi:type I site-specific restriction endonuclease